MTISRRKFIAGGAVSGAGLLIGVRFSGALLRDRNRIRRSRRAPNPFVAYMHVKPDGRFR